jgi:hypothetical protein
MPRRLDRALLAAFVVAVILAAPGGAGAQAVGERPPPISGDPLASGVPGFVGHRATPHRVAGERVPRNPFMAPNGRSNIHDDGYQSDSYRQAGPLGPDIQVSSALFFRECASVTFDSRGRLVTICVGLDRPVLAMIDPATLEPLATMDLPPRNAGGGAFTDFSGGGYFYLDHRDRAVVPTTARHVLVVAETAGPGLAVVRDYDLTMAVPDGDSIISVMPDWHGRLWFASKAGVVGTVARKSGRVRSIATGEPIGNSFAVGRHGGVFIVTDEAMYRFARNRWGKPRVVWRRRYPNIGVVKPGQTERGSGTTPTLLGRRYVAITDNADPMAVLVYDRRDGRSVCRQPVFQKGASSTDQSLIAAKRSLVVENNYGYTGPLSSTMNGAVTSPGIERLAIDRSGRGCHELWTSPLRSPSAVAKLSLAAGLVYTYVKPDLGNSTDAWYLAAINFRTGRTVYRRLAGTGFGYNNNFAPVTIAPGGGVAYVGALGGIVRFADGR